MIYINGIDKKDTFYLTHKITYEHQMCLSVDILNKSLFKLTFFIK